jgi:DNA processing protein
VTDAVADTKKSLTEAQRIAWLRLIRSENVGPTLFRELLNFYGSAEKALEALPEKALKARGKPIKIYSKSQAEKEIERAEKLSAQFVTAGDYEYPVLLKSMTVPPPVLCIRGENTQAQKPVVAIVGARNASISGCRFATQLTHELCDAGYHIVSGLARGIDTAVHKASLTSGTTAVIAGGQDCIYPKENIPLVEDIITHGGTVISEMPMGWVARAQDFPRRNRIVSGMSLGVVVVEAAKRSGALITARFANEQGRLVFAVPGSPLEPRSAGPNNLLKQGAILITNADDIIRELTPLQHQKTSPQLMLFEDKQAIEYEEIDNDIKGIILSAMGASASTIDDIALHTDIPVPAIRTACLELMLEEKIKPEANGSYTAI